LLFNATELPFCAREASGYLKGKLITPNDYCTRCQAVDEECGLHTDCSSGLCVEKTCVRKNILPGSKAIDIRQCFSGIFSKGICQASKNRCKQVGLHKGGCRCKKDGDCGGAGTCHGFVAGMIRDTMGTCEGTPPNALLCEGQRVKTDCCNNVECRWQPSEQASNDEALSGTCLPAGETAFPNRPICDWQYHQTRLNEGVVGGATRNNANSLLQSNEQTNNQNKIRKM